MIYEVVVECGKKARGESDEAAAGGLNSMDRFWEGGAGNLSAFQYGLEARGERNPRRSSWRQALYLPRAGIRGGRRCACVYVCVYFALSPTARPQRGVVVHLSIHTVTDAVTCEVEKLKGKISLYRRQ